MNPTKPGRYDVITWALALRESEWKDGQWWIWTPLGLEKTYVKQWRKSPKSKWIDV